MTKKISYRICSSLMAMFFFAVSIYAQNGTTDTVINGSTIKIETLQDDDQISDDETVTNYSDTLRSNFRSIVFDSIEAINTDKGFYYKRYLDSLLRASKLKKDTVIKKNRRAGKGLDFESKGFFNSVFGIIFLILAIGLVGYLIYRLFLSDSALFSRNRKNRSDINITTEETSNDPEDLLHKAIGSGNYRLAVRYLYLQVLDKLSERRFIKINSNKTNYEYVTEVRGQKFANEFASLTLQYDYVWYGEYPVDEKLFDQMQNSFIQFTKNLTR